MTGPRIIVGVSRFAALRTEGTLVTLGLGSCVAIALWDPTTLTGGLAHIMLPSKALASRADQPGRDPESALDGLLREMQELGSAPEHIGGRLVGGARMFANLAPPGSIQIGERNVLAARATLHDLGIPVEGEVVGGDCGRSVQLDVASGRVEISSVRRDIQFL